MYSGDGKLLIKQMFTGIIEKLGVIHQIQPAAGGKRITVETGLDLSETAIGESIAVNGVCLTVVSKAGSQFSADLSPETVFKTTFSTKRAGDRVNVERAMRLSDRINGHLVSGHIDGVGAVSARREDANAIVITIAVPPELAKYMIPKGSVAVDGISLTINHCDQDSFGISIIPHTAQLTSIGYYTVGDAVNIETDMLGKYVARLLKEGKQGTPDGGVLGLETLAKHGFL